MGEVSRQQLLYGGGTPLLLDVCPQFASDAGIVPGAPADEDVEPLHRVVVLAARHLQAQRALGVPYTDAMTANAVADAYGQAAPDSPFAALASLKKALEDTRKR